jgi:Leucine-rich repeat (LRR) protein
LLPPLNNSLEVLWCCENKLTFLPPLNTNTSLHTVHCFNNQLTSLPPLLHTTLNELYCSYNPLSCIPDLNDSLRYLIWNNTPIHTLLNGNRENIAKWNRFREYYFLSSLKKKFISWMWKSREERIKEQFHYKHLLRFMEESDNLKDLDLDPFLENFIK